MARFKPSILLVGASIVAVAAGILVACAHDKGGEVADASQAYNGVEATEKLTANTWANVTLTSDGTTMKLYVNGKQVASGSARTPVASSGELEIGCAANLPAPPRPPDGSSSPRPALVQEKRRS